jgi:SAM-dependent methyltransferase
MICRFDGLPLKNVLIDLGHCPPSNSYLSAEELKKPELTYPLKVFVSERTFYIQVPEFKRAQEIFNETYSYFSSFSPSWLKHCEDYVNMIVKKLKLSKNSFVVEIASNDGYLLQYFKKHQVPCLGIEPSNSVAAVARQKGVDTLVDFFGEKLARSVANDKGKADLILGNNVFAHVPDINDFLSGLKALLATQGVVTLEFPHLLNLMQEVQFDTIYHEHYSYFSLASVQLMAAKHGLDVFDVEQLPTHGGSLRVYLKHAEDKSKEVSAAVAQILSNERDFGLLKIETYEKFWQKVEKIKWQSLKFLIQQREAGKKIAAYGAAAKGNTFLNYCGVKSDLIQFVCDASPHKQGRFLPGSHIPIYNESRIRQEKPDYVVILPWNLKAEIMTQLSYIREWNGKFVTFIPEVRID